VAGKQRIMTIDRSKRLVRWDTNRGEIDIGESADIVPNIPHRQRNKSVVASSSDSLQITMLLVKIDDADP
jgi:hypothetical protein